MEGSDQRWTGGIASGAVEGIDHRWREAIAGMERNCRLRGEIYRGKGSQLEESDRRWRGAIAVGGEGSQVERREVIASGGEESQVEESDHR